MKPRICSQSLRVFDSFFDSLPVLDAVKNDCGIRRSLAMIAASVCPAMRSFIRPRNSPFKQDSRALTSPAKMKRIMLFIRSGMPSFPRPTISFSTRWFMLGTTAPSKVMASAAAAIMMKSCGVIICII